MGDFTRSFSNKYFKPLHYIVAWLKTKGQCWFCGRSTFMDPTGNQEKTCFTVLDIKDELDVRNLIVGCEFCTAKRKYKTPDEFREYLYRQDVNQAITENEDPGKVKRRIFWGEKNKMDYSLLKKMIGNMWDLVIKEIGDHEHPDDNSTMEEAHRDDPLSE